MSLEEFINEMKTGYGFRRPYRVKRIGDALDAMLPKDKNFRATLVEVKYIADSYGYGPDFHYSYTWKVRGVKLPDDLRTHDDLTFVKEEDGFTVGYDW